MEQKGFVNATMNYTADNGTAPEVYFYEPPAGTLVRPPGDDPREMQILDGWSRASIFHLIGRASSYGNSTAPSTDLMTPGQSVPNSTQSSPNSFAAQSERDEVIVFDHTIRSKVNAERQTAEHSTVQRAPVMVVHCDYTPASGPMRVRQLVPEEADELLKRRVAFYNLWKPLKTRVEEKPLAMCDVTSAAEDDMLKMALRYRDREGEIFVMRHAAAHRWWYFPKMLPENVLLLKTYESETDGRARFLGHSAFDDPNTPPDAPTRESIEIRMMAFF